ncbi:hypothetical protein ACVW1B_001928 [Bradyrhizobium sp. USDA 4502]
MEQNLPSVVAGQIEEWDFLIVTVFLSRILAIDDRENSLLHIDMRPVRPANFLLPHRGRNSVSDDAPDRDDLSRIGVEVLDELVELILSWAPVSLI